MKRVITLLMAAVMLIGTAGLASAAVEFKASGHMHIALGVKDNGTHNANPAGFDKDAKEDNFFAAQRFRPKLTMKADGVTAVFEAQQHQFLWGADGFGDRSGNQNGDVRVRNAYIDFKLPSTPVSLKVGYQQLSLPSIWGHPIFDTRVGGVVATVPFNDQAALAAFYARPWHNNGGDFNQNSIDMYGALLPLNFGTFKATPYVVYAHVGAQFAAATDNANYIVGGANLEITPMDALSIKVDGILTSMSSDDDNLDNIGFGFHLAAAVDYKMAWGTPGAFVWYTSGADEDGEDYFYSPRAFSDGFGPTSLGYEGYNTFWTGAWVGTSGMSSMGFGVQLADLSFIDSLKHTLRVAYIMGTADKDFVENYTGANGAFADEYLSEDWSFIEFNIDTKWSIYENLAAIVEIGAIIPDFDDYAGYEDDMAWRAQVTFRFSF